MSCAAFVQADLAGALGVASESALGRGAQPHTAHPESLHRDASPGCQGRRQAALPAKAGSPGPSATSQGLPESSEPPCPHAWARGGLILLECPPTPPHAPANVPSRLHFRVWPGEDSGAARPSHLCTPAPASHRMLPTHRAMSPAPTQRLSRKWAGSPRR